VAVGFRGFVRDITQVIDDLKAKAAAAQITLGINVDANSQIVADAGNASNAAIVAKQLESDINASLASGGPLKIDIGTLQFAASENGGAGINDLAKKIVDPVAIQAAIDQAIKTGDTASVQALLPLSLKLAEDPAVQMAKLLTTSLDAGGENSPTFAVLTNMATELQIDVPNIIKQYDDKLKEAAKAQTYSVTVDVHVKVNPIVDTSGIGTVAVNGAVSGLGGGAGTTPVPALASGGYINSDGLAYLHGGEVVLNQQQQGAFAGSRGGSKTYNVTVIGQAPYEVANMVNRATREQER